MNLTFPQPPLTRSATNTGSTRMVTYNRTVWVDGPSGNTALNAARLNNIEETLVLLASLVGSGNATVGNTLTITETANGYGVTAPIAGLYYRFMGLATPPFQRPGDSWYKASVGYEAPWEEYFTDSFDDAVGTSTNVDLAATEYGGDTSFFYQRTDGLLVPRNFSTTSPTQYLIIPKVSGAARQAVELSAINLSSNSTPLGPHVYLNVSSTNLTGANVTGYRVRVAVTSGVASWSCVRLDSGTATTIGAAFTEPDSNITRPFSFRVESDGAGTISYLRGTTVLASWTDSSGTPLTGPYVGVGANNTVTSTAASMNVKMDQLHVYKR